MEKTMEKIVALAKARGFVYPQKLFHNLQNLETFEFSISISCCIEMNDLLQFQKYIRINTESI